MFRNVFLNMFFILSRHIQYLNVLFKRKWGKRQSEVQQSDAYLWKISLKLNVLHLPEAAHGLHPLQVVEEGQLAHTMDVRVLADWLQFGHLSRGGNPVTTSMGPLILAQWADLHRQFLMARPFVWPEKIMFSTINLYYLDWWITKMHLQPVVKVQMISSGHTGPTQRDEYGERRGVVAIKLHDP